MAYDTVFDIAVPFDPAAVSRLASGVRFILGTIGNGISERFLNFHRRNNQRRILISRDFRGLPSSAQSQVSNASGINRIKALEISKSLGLEPVGAIEPLAPKLQ